MEDVELMQSTIEMYTAVHTHLKRRKQQQQKMEGRKKERKIAWNSINLNKIYFKCQRQRKTIFVVFI